MKLSLLCEKYAAKSRIVYDEEITSVTESTRDMKKGALFVCIKGARRDGHDFIPEAYRAGIRSFIVSREIVGYDDCNMIFVENDRKALAELSFALCGNPQKKLNVIGITGTKGKSTTGFVLYSVLNSLGVKCAFLGTIGAWGVECPVTPNTTPAPTVTASCMAQACERGIGVFILEVSSQAIKEERIYSIPFSLLIFTSMSEDHVGTHEHKSFDEYRDTKRRLFTDFGARVAVVNSDDEYADFMSRGVFRVYRVGVVGDVPLCNICSGAFKTTFELGGNFCNIKIPGKYNAYNFSLAAVAASVISGASLSCVVSHISDISVAGRFELISASGRIFVIDYAHNAQSAAAVLSECQRLTNGRVIAVYGSVGGRSECRRAPLARAVERYADVSVITADNPDAEETLKICEELKNAYLNTESAVVITDREAAIEYAFSISSIGDVIALLGKGHENFQLVGGVPKPFSERAIIARLCE